jgi:pyruvate dehydrogenase E1 component
MPDFWEYPTVSMGLGPINSIYQARFNRTSRTGASTTPATAGCGASSATASATSPRRSARSRSPAREQLDNLVWVVNCNLQRLDGPVRGNGKIIQELEAVFRGAGWNVIKVVWGSKWDELLARDVDGVLLNKMNTTVDGEFQRYAVEDGAYIREHFFGPDPRLRKMVEHLSDDELRNLPRGGHDYRKLYAAYKAATENLGRAPHRHPGQDGQGLDARPDVEGRNATHQIKKMTKDQLLALRDRLHLHDEIPDEASRPTTRRTSIPREDSRVPVHDGAPQGARRPAPPKRRTGAAAARAARRQAVRRAARPARATRRCRPRWAFTRLLRNLCRDPDFGERVVPIIPDEARTFGMDALFREFKIYAVAGPALRAGRPRAAAVLQREDTDGQILEEGITEAGSMASFIAAGTSLRHPRRADGAVLHLLLDVRLPAGRRPHLGRRPTPGPAAS